MECVGDWYPSVKSLLGAEATRWGSARVRTGVVSLSPTAVASRHDTAVANKAPRITVPHFGVGGYRPAPQSCADFKGRSQEEEENKARKSAVSKQLLASSSWANNSSFTVPPEPGWGICTPKMGEGLQLPSPAQPDPLSS